MTPDHTTLAAATTPVNLGTFLVVAFLVVIGAALATLALVIGYRVSLRRWPYTDCRPCGGTGYRYSRIFAHSFGYCPTCRGTGRRPRAGARLLARIDHQRTGRDAA